MAKSKKQAVKTAKKTAAVVAQVAPQVAKADKAEPKYTMRCYLVSCGPLSRLAATNADARAIKKELVEKTGRRPKDATIEDHELPYGKKFILGYINELMAKYQQGLLDKHAPSAEE